MDQLLITGGLVVTMDGDRRVIEDGAVAAGGGRILAVGPRAEVEAAHPDGRRIDARGMAVLPGFIDVHAHAGHGLVKTMGGGDSEAWTEAVETIYPRASTPAFWRAEARLSALERLMCGVTTGLSIFGAYGSRTDEAAYADAHVAAYAEVGVRNVLAVGTSPRPHPNRFVAWRNDTPEEREVSFAAQVAVCEDLVSRHHGAGTTRMMLTAPLWYPGRPGTEPHHVAAALEDAAAVRALSRARGIGFTQDGHRTGTVKAAHGAGLLGEDALLSHCIDITEEEIAIIAGTGTKVAHNPSAAFSIRGRCPAIELMEAGAVVAIASDGTAPDRSYDMFRHMWQAMHYHRRHFRDAAVLPPGKALEMGTCDAAAALGLGGELGSLEPGKAADVITVDLRKPHLYPPQMPLYRLVCFAVGSDVDTVVVGGRVLMEGRRVATVEPEAVLDDARIEAERAVARAGLARLLETPRGFWRATRYG